MKQDGERTLANEQRNRNARHYSPLPPEIACNLIEDSCHTESKIGRAAKLVKHVECQHDHTCYMCSGEYCATHYNSPCDCDVVDRHTYKVTDMPSNLPDDVTPKMIEDQCDEFDGISDALVVLRDFVYARSYPVSEHPEVGKARTAFDIIEKYFEEL